MSILFVLNGMVNVFLSLHDKQIKKVSGHMVQAVYDSQ